MNARFRVGSSAPSRAVCRGLLAGLLLPMLTAGCDILGPSRSGIVLEPFETTWLSEPVTIDPVTHPPEDPPPGEVMIDSLLYKADLLVADTALGTRPMSLTLRVRLRNPFDDPVTIQVPGCFAGLRAYASIDRMDPPIWDGLHSSLGLADCEGGVSDITVPPQEHITGSRLLHDVFLSRALPDGRYYFTLEFSRVNEEPLRFRLGSADVRFQEPGLEFDVSLEDRDGDVHVDVGLTNRNDVPIPLFWGGCSMRLELYHDAARTNLAREFWLDLCPSVGRSATLGPGETMHPDEFVRDFDSEGVLDLPSGTYFLSVRLLVNWFDYHIPAGEIRLR